MLRGEEFLRITSSNVNTPYNTQRIDTRNTEGHSWVSPGRLVGGLPNGQEYGLGGGILNIPLQNKSLVMRLVKRNFIKTKRKILSCKVLAFHVSILLLLIYVC